MNHTEILIERSKCAKIKQYLQRLSGVEDIGIKTRKREITDLRKAYCKLCKTFTKSSLSAIGDVLRPNFDHATVLYAVKEFKNLYSKGSLTCIDAYDKAFKYFNNLYNSEIDFNEEINKIIQTELNARINFAEIHFSLIEKSNEALQQKDAKIKELEAKIKGFEEIIFDIE